MRTVSFGTRGTVNMMLALMIVAGCTSEGGGRPDPLPTATATVAWGEAAMDLASPTPEVDPDRARRCAELIEQFKVTSQALVSAYGNLDADPQGALAQLEAAHTEFQTRNGHWEAEAQESASVFDSALDALIDATTAAVNGTDVDTPAVQEATATFEGTALATADACQTEPDVD